MSYDRKMAGVTSMTSTVLDREMQAPTVAMLEIARALDVPLLELVPRVVIERRVVGPATLAPSGSRDRIRIVLDGASAWEGGWDAVPDPGPFVDPLDIARIKGWKWRERWMDPRFGS